MACALMTTSMHSISRQSRYRREPTSYRSRGRNRNDSHAEVQELNPDVFTDKFLSAERAFTYADLCAMVRNRNTLVWLTPHAVVA